MRKISGIIPPNARTQSAEIARSQPARPGAPSMGRPMGKNSLGDRITLSNELEEMRANRELPERELSGSYPNMQEARRAKTVQALSDKFFSAKGSIENSETPKSEVATESVTERRSLFTVEPELLQPRPELKKA